MDNNYITLASEYGKHGHTKIVYNIPVNIIYMNDIIVSKYRLFDTAIW